MVITFINSMVVPEDQTSRFIEFWDRGAKYVSSCAGFRSTSLHRNVHDGDHQFYTVACWDSEEAFKAATSSEWWSEFAKEFGFGNPLTGLVATPAICEVVRDDQNKFS